MVDPYVVVFVVLLVVYVGYSLWARLDPRYPIGAALVLLIVAAVTDAAGGVGAANVLAEFVFLLLGAGVLLLLLEHVREGRRSATPSGGATGDAQAADAAEQRERSADQPLDGSQ